MVPKALFHFGGHSRRRFARQHGSDLHGTIVVFPEFQRLKGIANLFRGHVVGPDAMREERFDDLIQNVLGHIRILFRQRRVHPFLEMVVAFIRKGAELDLVRVADARADAVAHHGGRSADRSLDQPVTRPYPLAALE